MTVKELIENLTEMSAGDLDRNVEIGNGYGDFYEVGIVYKGDGDSGDFITVIEIKDKEVEK